MSNRPRKRFSMRTERRFMIAIRLYVSDCSELESACNVVRSQKKAEFSTSVFNFFATTAEPSVDKLIRCLRHNIAMLETILGATGYEEAAEQLMILYNAYLATEGLKPPLEISSKSALTFQQDVDKVLSDWEDYQIAIHWLKPLRISFLEDEVFGFFIKPAEPYVDKLAEVVHRFSCAKLDGLIDFSDCKKVAQQFCDIYQSFLDKRSRRRKNSKRREYINRCETINEFEGDEEDDTSTNAKEDECDNGEDGDASTNMKRYECNKDEEDDRLTA